MERRVAYVLVGLFSLLLIGGFAAFVLWAHQQHGGEKNRIAYLIEFNQAVNGLSLGSSVRYLGVEVGQVQAINLEAVNMPPRVRVIVEIDQNILITKGDVATIKPSGITGVSFIDMRHDIQNSEPLVAVAPAQLPVIRSEASDIDRLLASGTNAAQHLDEILNKADRFLNDTNQNHISQTLSNLDTATGSLKVMMNSLQKNGFDKDVSMTLHDGRRAANNFSDTMLDAKDAVDNFSDLSRSLHENPSRLIYPSVNRGVEINP